MKKILLTVLIVVAIVQLFVPAYMVWERYDVLTTGKEVKMRVRSFNPYDAFRGRYVSLWFDYNFESSQRNGQYGILEEDENGFATVTRVVSEKPMDNIYLVSRNDKYFYMPFDRYYMEESLAPNAEKALNGNAEAYITVRIKGSKSVVSGLYINGISAEKLLSEGA